MLNRLYDRFDLTAQVKARLKKVAFGLYWRLTGRQAPFFIHIPKTGGTYIHQSETDRKPVISPMRYLGHVCVAGEERTKSSLYPPDGFRIPRIVAQKELDEGTVLSVVRNPFSWLVSYAGHAGGWNQRYSNPKHYDYENANKGFDYLVKSITNRESPWPSRKFIHFQIFADNGDLVVDLLARNETLDQDLELFSSKLGLRYVKKDEQRVGGEQDYRSRYNDSLVELVKQTWGRELKLFGYDFNGIVLSSALLKRHVDRSTKQRIRYFWSEDKLLVDGKVIS